MEEVTRDLPNVSEYSIRNLDANGRVESSTVTITELACDEGCVDNLNETKHVILLVTAGTVDYNSQQSVKIYNDYKLGLSMALLISGRIF